MKFSAIFIIGFLALSIFGAGSFFVYKVNCGNIALEEQIESHLISVAEGKSQVLSFYLDERKEDLEFLIESKEVRDSLVLGLVSEENKKMLSNFREVNNYLDLILVDVDGKILFDLNGVGKIQNDDGLNAVYEKVQNDFGVGIFDPGYFGDEELSIFVTTPAIVETSTEKREIIGYLFLRIDNYEVESRVSKDIGFGEIGSTYVVNRDGGLITQPKKGELYKDKISSEMFEDCFKDYKNYYFERSGDIVIPVKKSGVYENYKGEKVYGAHQYILQNSWCVLAEVDKKEFEKRIFNDEKKSINNMIYGFSGMLAVIFIFLFILGKDFKIGGEK